MMSLSIFITIMTTKMMIVNMFAMFHVVMNIKTGGQQMKPMDSLLFYLLARNVVFQEKIFSDINFICPMRRPLGYKTFSVRTL